MPLAAPLILPFAQLAGITIAGLGMAAASEKISDFISDNPELSKQILITLVPGGAGLNTLFKKEAGITLEDLDEMTDEEAADLSKEDKAEIMKEVGKSKGGNKRQRMIEISEKLGLSGEGKEKQTIVDEVEERYDEGGVEDAPKPKFDYKKFFRNRRADGGAIGIEVLFEEKKNGGRIGFANGGIENIIGKNLDNVTNVAKGLDKEMLDMTYSDKYYKDVIQPAKLGQGPIPSKMQMIGQNLKNFGPVKAMFIGAQPGKYGERAQPTKAASQFLNTLGKGAKFVGTKVGPLSFMDLFASTPLGADDEVTDEMRQSIEVTPTRTNVQGMDLEMDPGARINPNIQPQQNIFQRAGNVFSSIKDNIPNFGIMGLLSNLDRFDTLSPEDQAFILEQSGGNRPSKDRYGINRRSAFGNYAQYVRDKGIFAKGPRGEYYRSISGLDQALLDTLDREQKAKAAYEKQIRDAADEAARNRARARSITAGYGGADESRGATGATAAGAGMGVDGGYASDYFGAYGGSVPTGLATMFVEKR